MQLDPENPASVRADVRSFAKHTRIDLCQHANGFILFGIPGLVTCAPYYWWEAGAMLGNSLITGTTRTIHPVTILWGRIILHQIWGGHDQNFVRAVIPSQTQMIMPANQSKAMRNDDRLFWAITVMSAAEYIFLSPPPDQIGWLGLAQSIYNQMSVR
jgi:mannan endo-1,6-alpha-mannosidase